MALDEAKLTYGAGDILGFEDVAFTYGRQKFKFSQEAHNFFQENQNDRALQYCQLLLRFLPSNWYHCERQKRGCENYVQHLQY